MLLMAVLIALSLYFNAGEQQDKKQAERPVSVPAQTTEQQPHPQKIDELTKQANVVSYMQKHQQLPSFYITKKRLVRLVGSRNRGTCVMYYLGKRLGR